jgi:hypothetical protein
MVLRRSRPESLSAASRPDAAVPLRPDMTCALGPIQPRDLCRTILCLGLGCLGLLLASSLGQVLATQPADTDQPGGSAQLDPAASRFFEEKVRPVLANRCYLCHGPEKQKNDFRLDSRAAMLKGGNIGPALQPGKPEESLLIRAIRHDQLLQMPPSMKLSTQEIADLTTWVQMGAPWPDVPRSLRPEPSGSDLLDKKERSFWAFQPLADPPVPAVQNPAWAQAPLDRFILAKLEEKGLSPAPLTDKRTLIRRATFDLIGLPPSPAEIETFLADSSSDAFARVVDRLLASPLYGERWGRHWLDVARYADSNGMDENLAHGNAFRYRDYVVAAFNQDKPYDQFLREQVAGDLLPAEDDATTFERLIATGFLSLGPKMLAEDDPIKMEMDIVDEQIDTVGRTFLGLTLGCARCHDHKFDPIPTADYYALAGIFKSTKTMDHFKVVARWHERPLAPKEAIARRQAHEDKTVQKKSEIENLVQHAKEQLIQEARQQVVQYLQAAKDLEQDEAVAGNLRALLLALSRYPIAIPPVRRTTEQLAAERKLNPVFLKRWVEYLQQAGKVPTPEALSKVVSDPQGPFVLTQQADAYYRPDTLEELKRCREELAALEKSRPVLPEAMAVTEGNVANVRIHLRGNHLTQGQEVPRRFLRILAGSNQTPIDDKQSGRLPLAEWLTRADHPLTSRVMVNRLWHDHFGAGLVRTLDNFGMLGDRPVHQLLLDWLAVRFVHSGWSIKAMHRLLMLSSTYQMSAAYDEKASLVDPENRLHWRKERRRLEAEALRDALLAVGGQLEFRMGDSLLQTENRQYVTSNNNRNYDNYDSHRRSLYLPVIRSALYEVFQAFDFADPSVPNGDRAITTVAPQALFMMNGKLVREQTRHMARGLLDQQKLDDAGRVRWAYETAYGRPPSERETSRALAFVKQVEAMLAPQKTDAQERRLLSWQSLCRVILASNEFIYVE